MKLRHRIQRDTQYRSDRQCFHSSHTDCSIRQCRQCSWGRKWCLRWRGHMYRQWSRRPVSSQLALHGGRPGDRSAHHGRWVRIWNGLAMRLPGAYRITYVSASVQDCPFRQWLASVEVKSHVGWTQWKSMFAAARPAKAPRKSVDFILETQVCIQM